MTDLEARILDFAAHTLNQQATQKAAVRYGPHSSGRKTSLTPRTDRIEILPCHTPGNLVYVIQVVVVIVIVILIEFAEVIKPRNGSVTKKRGRRVTCDLRPPACLREVAIFEQHQRQ